MNKTYEITHSWGDPREPEYQDGLPIFYAIYRDRNIYLHFKIVPRKQPEASNITWVVVAPESIREAVGGSLSKCMEICNRVSEYVNSINSSTHWHMRDMSIIDVSLDTSKIPGWLATKVKILRSRYAWLLLHLPTLYPTLILISGYIIAYLSYSHRLNITHHATVKTILLTLGCMALIRLLSEIHESYEISKIGTVSLRFRNPTFNYKWFSLKGIFRCYGIRYAITSTLSIMLLYFAVYSV